MGPVLESKEPRQDKEEAHYEKKTERQDTDKDQRVGKERNKLGQLGAILTSFHLQNRLSTRALLADVANSHSAAMRIPPGFVSQRVSGQL